MLLTDEQVNTRLESPLNLVNRLNALSRKTTNGMELFIPNNSTNDSITNDKHVESSAGISTANDDDELDNIIPDNAQKIKLGIVKQRALDVLHDSLNHLHMRLPEIDKIRDFSTIARDMNAILTAEDSKKSNIHQQVIVYRPVINDISKYETLVVNE